jgi:triacylglycerol lipase
MPEYFPNVRRTLEAAGHRVLVPRVSPTAGVATRAAELRRFLDREAGRRPVHVLGHSMGGLDARYMIARLGMADRVLSLTTIATPHRGTTFADWGVARFARTLRPLFRSAGVPYEAFYDLMTDACRRFNEDVPDVPGVRYFAVAGVCERPLLGAGWVVPARIVGRVEGPNDGVVSVASATWGERTEVWDGDHLNLANWPNRKARRLGLTADRTADYARLVGGLAEMFE